MLNLYQLKGFLDTGWKTSKEIIEEFRRIGIHATDTEVRQSVKYFNSNYKESDLFIAHSRKGFLLTTNKELIESSCKDKEKRAMAMLKEVADVRKAKSLKTNIKLDIYNHQKENYIDEYVIVNKMIDGKMIKIKQVVRNG